MSKTDETKALIELEEKRLEIQEKLAEKKVLEAKEKRENRWIYIIWSIGAIAILMLIIYGKAHSWFY